MATYQFSALADGQSISFSPTADLLNFDQSAISGADIRVTAVGANTHIEVVSGTFAGKDITLLNVTPLQITTSNVSFANGSRIVIGDNAANLITQGTSGSDLVMGFGGNDDLVLSLGGNDVIDGGANFDTMSFSAATSALVVDFATGTVTGIGSMVFINIERVVGSSFGDVMNGAAGAQNLTGGRGEDTLWGGDGVDALWGNQDPDTFVFREVGTANADKIGDFATDFDQIVLDGSVLTALGATGNFTATDARFYAAAGATSGHDADDRIIFNTTTKELYYDADGSGPGSSVLIVQVQSTGTIAASDLVVEGGTGPAPTVGTEGNDSLVGTTANDTIDGLGGHDTILGEGGSDLLIGGTGNDSLVGGFNVDFLPEEDPGDRYIGGAGDDTLDGALQHHGGLHVDTMDGGLGNDVFHIDNPADVISDSGGVDHVVAYDMDWTLASGFEHLTINNDASESAYRGVGNELDNRMQLMWGGGTLEGLGGNDTVIGGVLDSSLFGGTGNDSLVGGDKGNLFDGGEGQDTLVAGSDISGFNTFLFSAAPGAANADRIIGFSSADLIQLDGSAFTNLGFTGAFTADDPRFHNGAAAHDADDRMVYDAASGNLWYDADGNGSGTAQLIAILTPGTTVTALDFEVVNGGGNPGELIVGTNSADALEGGAGDDTIRALEANDTVDISLGGTSSYGDDVVDGGSGFDALDFNGHAVNGIVADFNTGMVTGGDDGTGSVTFVNIERIVAGAFNDHITGNAAANNLDGRTGDDTLIGGGGGDVLWGIGGNDWLQGGTGVDTVNGNIGADRFVYAESGGANADRINDFVSGTDDIYLDDAAFLAIGALGSFTAGDARFASGAGITTGQDASDRIIYNTTTDSLYYDADGSGSGGSVLIATFGNNPTLVATDLFVF